MKKILVLFAVLTISLNAQEAGKTGLSFLKFGFGARNIALGNIGVISSSDVTALYYNPALLSEFSGPEIIFTHNEWIQDVRSELLGASFSLFGVPFAVGINTTTISDIETRTKPGDPLSKFNANYFSGSLSTGFEIIDNIAFGFTIKYLYEGLLSDEATGWGYDLGIFYKSPVDRLVFGAALRNLGSMNELRNETTKLPAELAFGSMYTIPVENLNSEVVLGTEYQNLLNDKISRLNIGGEFIYNKLVAVRVGYQIQSAENAQNFSAGLGLFWGNLNFDYALIPFKYSLGTAHTLSIKFKF